jgi:hypothetical protein
MINYITIIMGLLLVVWGEEVGRVVFVYVVLVGLFLWGLGLVFWAWGISTVVRCFFFGDAQICVG